MSFTAAAIICLAQNIFWEARGETFEGKLAVGIVTLNRVSSPNYPNNVCDVVWQRKQFSWTHDGKSDNPKSKNSYIDKQAWIESKKIAKALIKVYPIKNSISYHSKKVNPYWANKNKKVGQIGNHIFYK